jgi:hypothetical protein
MSIPLDQRPDPLTPCTAEERTPEHAARADWKRAGDPR